MNLKEIEGWARSIDTSSVDKKKQEHARCYKGMIINTTKQIHSLTTKVDEYMNNIQEYVEQLEKINVVFPKDDEGPKEEIIETKKEHKKESPLLP